MCCLRSCNDGGTPCLGRRWLFWHLSKTCHGCACLCCTNALNDRFRCGFQVTRHPNGLGFGHVGLCPLLEQCGHCQRPLHESTKVCGRDDRYGTVHKVGSIYECSKGGPCLFNTHVVFCCFLFFKNVREFQRGVERQRLTFMCSKDLIKAFPKECRGAWWEDVCKCRSGAPFQLNGCDRLVLGPIEGKGRVVLFP